MDPRSEKNTTAPQKYLAARNVSRTAPEVVTTATILIRFRVAISNVGEVSAGV
jgi:hypothetical protein